MMNIEKGRKIIRLSDYDYSQPGAYFITICTHERKMVFGDIRSEKMKLNNIGIIIDKWWMELLNKFPAVQIDFYVIMPNHFHGILIIEDYEKAVNSRTEIGLSTILQWYKTMTTNELIREAKAKISPYFERKLWQRSYYDHVIRNERELRKIREYIIDNPLKWHLDRENPESPNFDIDHDKYFADVYG